MAAPSLFKEPSSAPSGEPGPVCGNCSAPLAVGQHWCLECGTAVPGRLRTAPGLRSSLGVVGVTLLLVVGAVAAVYAAASSDSKQVTQTTAGLPAQTPVSPDVPAAATPAPGTALQAPAVATPAPATGATKLPTAPKLPAATPTPAPTPTAPVTVAPTTSTPKTTTKTPTTAVKPKPPTTPTTSVPSATSAKILLDTDAASTYNPYSLPPGGFGDPAKAIDGDPQTTWTYQLDSSTAGKTLVGLAIDLKSKQTVRSITIATPSAGMTVEFYGATGSELPVSITDPGWVHLATRTAVKAQTTVKLRSAKGLHYLLVWITHAPSGVTTGTLGVSELSVSS